MLDRGELHTILATYASGLSAEKSGFLICCPFHDDTNPSCTVFYESGVFSCLSGCGSASPRRGLLRLGVPKTIVDQLLAKAKEVKVDMERPIGDLSVPQLAMKVKKDPTLGILTEEPWSPTWKFRDLHGDTLSNPEHPVVKLFNPKLVRLWIENKKGIRHQERFPRLALTFGEHHLYLRLSSEQPIKVLNSSNLDLSDLSLLPFGLKVLPFKPELAGIIIVEGPYDLLMTVQNLVDLGAYPYFEVVSILGVSHWGTFLKKFQLRLLPFLGQTPIILAFDNDKAGESLTTAAKRDLRTLLLPREQILTLKYGGKDPGATLKEPFRQSLLQLGF